MYFWQRQADPLTSEGNHIHVMAPPEDLVRLAGVDSTDGGLEADATVLSRRLRPDVLGDPEQRRQRQAIEAALFGGAVEPLSVGRFRLLHRLGEGGMGTVYAAFDEHLDRQLAVKLMRPRRVDDAQLRERTLREARALARLSHPNVVHVYEVDEFEGQLFVAMEFLAGPTLHAWLHAEKRPWREVLQVFSQAGEGLVAAHTQGIVHRDFKPHNAMFGADARVRVLDFGLARFGDFESERLNDAGGREDARGALTMTGTILGTPAYMAPEQVMAGQTSPRSDQFSFCVALFEALYGERPLGGQTIGQLIDAVTAGAIAARPRDTEVPRWVHAVLVRGLAINPDQRWPSMRELLAALGRDPATHRRRRAAGGALIVALTGAVSFAFIGPRDVPVELVQSVAPQLERADAQAHAGLGQEVSELSEVAWPKDPPTQAWIEHQVIPTETLTSIAQRYDVPRNQVMRWNHLPDDDTLAAGQVLRIRADRQPLPYQQIRYTPKANESWAQVAARFELPLAALRAYNPTLGDELDSRDELILWVMPDPPTPRSDVDIPELGVRQDAISIGLPYKGRLERAIQFPANDRLYQRRAPRLMWCSSSVAQHLPQAIARLRARYDFEGDIVVSDMSLRDGGPFAPHKSHQNGRDVDIWLPMLKGVYEPEYLELDRQPYSDETDWFALYGLLVELQETGAVEAVFLQWKLQEKVYAAAKLMGASDQELASMITWPRPALSQTGPQQALLQHSDAYISQIHVRFACAANDIDCSAR